MPFRLLPDLRFLLNKRVNEPVLAPRYMPEDKTNRVGLRAWPPLQFVRAYIFQGISEHHWGAFQGFHYEFLYIHALPP